MRMEGAHSIRRLQTAKERPGKQGPRTKNNQRREKPRPRKWLRLGHSAEIHAVEKAFYEVQKRTRREKQGQSA